MTDSAIATVAPVTDPRELALLKAVGFDKLSNEQRELALNICKRYDLDPLLKHLVMIEGRPYITRDGLLHVAHNSKQLDGIETSEPSIAEGFWRATASVYRKDMTRPFTYFGRYPTSGGNAKYAPEMAVKVAEVMALRRAFDVAAPTAEERWDIPEVEVSRSASAPSLAERAAAKRAEVEAAPVEGVGLSRGDFLAALTRAGITPDTAKARSQVLYPGIAGTALTDAQRADLLTDLLNPENAPEPAAAEVQPSGQAHAGSPSPEEEAELDATLALLP